MNNIKHANRELWLNAAVDELRPMFQALANEPAAQRIRVACGKVGKGRSKALGECNSDKASADHTFEIWVAPKLDNPRDVFAVLVHEVAHTCAGHWNHGRKFARTCDALGLMPSAGKGYKATVPSDKFDDLFAGIILSLGDYPHAALNTAEKPPQKTRLLPFKCVNCGFAFWTTATHVAKGLPKCQATGLDENYPDLVCNGSFQAK